MDYIAYVRAILEINGQERLWDLRNKTPYDPYERARPTSYHKGNLPLKRTWKTSLVYIESTKQEQYLSLQYEQL